MKTIPSLSTSWVTAFKLSIGMGLALMAHRPAHAQGTLTKVDGGYFQTNGSIFEYDWAVLANYNSFLVRATGNANRSAASTVTGVTITLPGAGYLQSAPPKVKFTGGGGTGAAGIAVISADGRVTGVTMTNPGSGYSSAPAVEFEQPSPGGIGSSVNFNTDNPINITIKLEGDRTVGRMNIGDLSSGQTITLQSGTVPGSLIFNNAGNGGGALLNKFVGTTDTIAAPIILNDQLNARLTTSRVVLSGAITGNGNYLTSYGNGVLAITGDNSASDYKLWLWNKGVANANAQVELGATTGSAAGDIIIGNASRGTSGHAVLQLQQNRTNTNQIRDDATIWFDSFSGSGRNNYFKLMGANETVGRIVDMGSLAVIQNREGETVNTSAKLILAGNGDSFVSGFIRDNTGAATAQADQNGAPGVNAMALEKNGTGTLYLSGTNISFTGGMTVGGGTAVLRSVMNFRSDITNNGTVVFDTTGATSGIWNFSKIFTNVGSNGRVPISKNLIVSGTGNVEKTGLGILNLSGNAVTGFTTFNNFKIDGSLTVRNGSLNLTGLGAEGAIIGKKLILTGDSGLVRKVELKGQTKLGQGIDAYGGFNIDGNTISITGGILSQGDRETSYYQPGIANITGPINLNHVTLRLESGVSVAKTSVGGVNAGRNITVSESSSIVVGMRVTSTQGNIPEGTLVQSFNPVTRVVTLNKDVTIGGGSALQFIMDGGTLASSPDGVIQGAVTNITIAGRPSLVGSSGLATTGGSLTSGGLSLINNQYSNMTNRIPDSTAIILKGGFVELVNDASTKAFSEKLGTLSLVEGQAQISVYQAGSGAGGSSVLTFASLNRSPGTSIEFAGRSQTGAKAELGINVRSQIKFDTVPVLDDGIIGGWAWSDNDFVKYTTTNGVTKLTASDYRTATASTDWNSWAATHNVKMMAAQTLGVTNAASRKAINSLNLQSDMTKASTSFNLTLNHGSLLSIDTGGLLSGHGNHNVTGTVGTGNVIPLVTVGTAFNTPGELSAIVGHTITNLVTGAVGASTLTFATATIGDFKLSVTQTSMTTATDVMTIPTGTAAVLKVGMQVNHPSLPTGTTILQIINDTTIKLSAKPTSNIALASSTTFLGGSVGLTKSGAGTLILTNNLVNTHSGPTIVNNGVLKLRQDSNLGPSPTALSSKHLQINGGTLMFARDNIGVGGLTVGTQVPDYDYNISDGTRGVYFGAAGGRLTVGDKDPSPVYLQGGTSIFPRINVTINNKIEADGLVELAVYGNSTWSNKLVLGTPSSTNVYRGGIKTEGSFGGLAIVNGQNTINGLFVEGGTITFPHANNFSGTIRVFNGTLNLDGANKYNGTTNFSDTLTITSGTVNLGHAEALGNNGIKLNMGGNGAQLRLLGTDQRLTSITGVNSSIISNGSTVANKPSKLTIDIEVNESYLGRLNNGGATNILELIKTGTGRLSLTNNESDFYGKVSILGGVLDISSIRFYGSQSALGRGDYGYASEILIDGGALSISPARDPQFTNRSFTIGSGANAATLVANGSIQAARVIMGAKTSTIGDFVEKSDPIGFSGNGARTLTLSGINLGNNEFQLQLSDKSATEPSSLLKAGPGNWVLGTAADFSGQVTVQDGILAVAANNVLGTKSILTTVDVAADTFVGNIPNGVEVSFIELFGTVLPRGVLPDTRYYVINSTPTTFKVSLTKGGTAIDLQTHPTQGAPKNVGFVPNIKSVASTVGVAATDTFTGNLPNGTPVVFNTQIQLRAPVTNTPVPSVLPTGIKSTETYYVMNSNGTTFQVSKTLATLTKVLLGSNSVGPIYYTAALSFDSSEVNLLGGRLELRNVDYMAREKITFQGGALAVAPNLQARWAGDWDVQANSNITVGVNSELILDGNLLGSRALTLLGEGTLRLRGESIMPTLLNSPTSDVDNSRRSFTVQAGTLILDYSLNNNSKLVDIGTLALGGGRRGGTIRLQGGNHEEIVNGVTLSAGANKIYRDSGESVIRLNNINRQEGSSLYFDLARIARVDNLNLNNILGGWAIIRDAVVQASWVLTGTVSRNFSANPVDDVLTIPVSIPPNPTLSNHYLSNGTPVRLSTNGVLPAPLQSNVTYYVTSAGPTRTFKLSTVPFGLPIDITDAGTPGTTQHTVATYQPQRTGPATLTFTAHPDNYPGSSGNNLFRIQIQNQTTPGPITSTVTGSLSTPPIVYTIKTSSTVNSAEAIRNFVNTDSKVTGYFIVTVSGADTVIDRGSYGPKTLDGGSNDNGSQELGWARNGTNTGDGYVQVSGFYEPTNVWTRDGNTNIVGDIPLLNADSVTYTLRYAANAASTTNLAAGSSPDSVHTLQTGAILVSPTVGANDSLIMGPGSLTTENMGNLRSFVIHQYNEQGDLIIGAALVNRRSIQRVGRLTDGNRRILAGITTTANMVKDVTTVTGTGVPANTVVVKIIDENAVELNNEATAGDNRWELTFTTDGLSERYFASQQGTNTQNRIMGIKDSSGKISSHDLYIGMPIAGPGIPIGATVSEITNDSDIRINANHFFNGILTELTFGSSVGVDKLGPGTLVLAGDNTYSGITTIADGVLRAQKLTDGGVAGSLGISAGNVAGNLVFNGGVLQYVGESTSTNRFFNITDFAQINIGHEKTTAIFSGNVTSSGTLNAADRLEKAGSGTLEMRGDANVNEIKVMEGTLRVQAVDKDPLPQVTSTTNVGQNSLASLRVAGGVFEYRGLAEAGASLTLGGSFYVDAGNSVVRATSVPAFDPMNRVVAPTPRTTSLNLMGSVDGASIIRSSGGTVRFVENPEPGAGNANIFLNTGEGDLGRVLGWAVYEDTSTVGVNHFATINANPLAKAVVAASGLYNIGSRFTDANKWALPGEGGSLNVSEDTTPYEVYFPNGVTVTAGSNVINIAITRLTEFQELRVGMSVTGPGLPAATFITAINEENLTVTVTNGAISSPLEGAYSFLMPLTFGGRVGLARPDLAETVSENSAGRDREVNTIRYTSTGDSVVSIDLGSTLKLASGAILLATDVKGGEKSIVGPGNITGIAKADDGSDLIIHNYNNVSAFTIGANIIDNIQLSQFVQVGAAPMGLGYVTQGLNTLYMPEAAETLAIIRNLHVGMEVTGTGVPPDTYIASINGTTLYLTKPATLTTPSGNGTIFSFRSRTSFVQAGVGTTILSGNNTYTGNTYVHGGVLRLDSAAAVPGGITSGALANASSRIIVKDGVLGLGLENFSRSLGSGTNQIEFKGSGGFAAYGANRTVDFGGVGASKRLRFGNDGFVPDGSSFILGAADATHKVTVLNGIDLGSFSQVVRVDNGSAEVEGELAGSLSGVGRLIKYGLGTLRLSAQNVHGGGIEIAEGRLMVAAVNNVFGTGAVTLGTSTTNTNKNAVIELSVEGGTHANNLVVGNANTRGADWVSRGTAGGTPAGKGTQSSMLVVNGTPAIAYYDPINQDLKYVRSMDARGTNWFAPVTLDSKGNVGQYPSLTIVNGMPAVSYYDATNKTLNFVRSTDASGAVWGVPLMADTNLVNAVATLSDGSIIAAGNFVEFDGAVRTRLVRLSTTGTVNGAFAPQVDGEIKSIVVDSSDRIVVAGTFKKARSTGSATDIDRNNIARFSNTGVLDESFNPNVGGGTVSINAIIIQPDGRMVIGGEFANVAGVARTRLARLEISGALDTTFTVAANGEVFALLRQSNGDILIGGTFTNLGGIARNRVARVTSAGVLDASFNPNVNESTTTINTTTVVRAIAMGTDNSIYIGGAFTGLTGTGTTTVRTRNRLAKLNLAGNIDANYGLELNGEVRGLYTMASGKIVLTGLFTEVGNAKISSMARLNVNGTLDSTFTPEPNGEVRSVLESSGKMILGGLFSNVGGGTQQWVGRINENGTVDTTFIRNVDDRGQYSSLALVPESVPTNAAQTTTTAAIAYHDAVAGDLRYTRASNSAATAWENSVIVDSTGVVGRGISMKVANIGGNYINKTADQMASRGAVAISGTPAIAYYDETSQSLKYVLSNTLNGSDWSSPITIQQTQVGPHFSLEIIEGNPAVAYYNSATKKLHYRRSNNVAGLSDNLPASGTSLSVAALEFYNTDQTTGVAIWGDAAGFQLLDESTDVGQYPSLALVRGPGSIAVPAVAYYDAAGGNLKYVQANNTTGIATGVIGDPVPWGTPVTAVDTANDVGQYVSLVLTDGVPAVSYTDATSQSVQFVHFGDSAGYSLLSFTGDTTLGGNITLDGTSLISIGAGKTLTANGSLTGAAGFKLIGEGSMLINSSNNNFGVDLKPTDQAPAVIRSGNLLLGSSTALNPNLRIDLGDRDGALQTLSVAYATNGASVMVGQNAQFVFNGSNNGSFIAISSTVGGHQFTTADVGSLILIKDETDVASRNGIYQITLVDQTTSTMNLVRASVADSIYELTAGLRVHVLNGALAKQTFMLAESVSTLNVSPVSWVTTGTSVVVATTGKSLTTLSGFFDRDHNGLFGNAGGPGAFVQIDTTIDGRLFSEDDVGTLILVKDETNAAWNGIYRIIYSAGLQPNGTMNLVRAPEMDSVAEFIAGLQVRVLSGTSAGKVFMLANDVAEVNVSPVYWVPEAANSNVGLFANVSGLSIGNSIDLSVLPGTGRMTLGAVNTLTSGSVEFTGPITFKDNQLNLKETQTLELTSQIANGYGVTVSGVISEQTGSGNYADVLSIIKTGSGVVTLRGNNTFHGGVAVNEGTLLVMNTSGSATGTGAVSVNGGGTLGGIGRIAGAVNLTGTGTVLATQAKLHVGDPTSSTANETLTIDGKITVGANSVVEFSLGVSSVTKLVGNGGMEITETGRLVVSLQNGYRPAVGATFDILDLTGALSFTSGNSNILLSDYLKLPGIYIWDTSTFLTDGIIKILAETIEVQIVSSPTTVTLNPEQALNLTVTVTGSPDFIYQWQRSIAGGAYVNYGSPVRSSSTTNTLTIPSVAETDEGYYRVVVTNGEGTYTKTSGSASVMVNDPPTIVTQPLPVTINPGATAVFKVVVTGPSPYSYKWYRGTTEITAGGRISIVSTGETSTLTITNVTEADDGNNYNVVASNPAAGVRSNLVALSVNDPAGIATHPQPRVVSAGDYTRFEVVASGTGPFTYQWQIKRVGDADFVNIPGATQSSLRIEDITLADNNAQIRVIVNNIVGIPFTSNPATLTVGSGEPTFSLPWSRTMLDRNTPEGIEGKNNTLVIKYRVGGAQTGRKVVWKRNGKVLKDNSNIKIGGVTSAVDIEESTPDEEDNFALWTTLTITNISPGLGGDYTVEVKNVTVKKPSKSPPARIAIIGNPFSIVPAANNAKKATLNAVVGAPKSTKKAPFNITYKWMRLTEAGTEDIAPTELRYTGINTKTLTIANVTTADSATYVCQVTTDAGGVTIEDEEENEEVTSRTEIGATQELRVYTGAPELRDVVFPPAMVGADFNYQIPINPDPSKVPVSYRATGLPPGLKLDTKTGKITGRPTVAKVDGTPYLVSITISNAFKPDSKTDPAQPPQLMVYNIPVGSVGVFAGWIPRHDLNGDVGGRFDLTTTGKGTFTGKVTLGKTVYPFKGNLALDPNSGLPNNVTAAIPTGIVNIPRKGSPLPTPMKLTFRIDPKTNLLGVSNLVASEARDDGNGNFPIVTLDVPIYGWRNQWSELANPANSYLGYHTFALLPPEGSAEDFPQGDSYAYFTVDANGKFNIVGRTADGQAFTGAQFIGPRGEIVIYHLLYKATDRGSLVGQVSLNANDTSRFDDNTISVTSGAPTTAPTWMRPADISAKNLLYSQGFGPLLMGVTGGAYEDPTRELAVPGDPPYKLILDILEPGPDQAELVFSLSGLNHVGESPSIPYVGSTVTSTDSIDVDAENKVYVPIQPGGSGAPLLNPYGTTLSVNAKMGTFTGRVNVVGPPPVTGGKPPTRTATYQGLIVRTSEGLRGVGYFLMQSRLAVGTEKPNTIPQVSNQVLFAPYDEAVTPPEPTE